MPSHINGNWGLNLNRQSNVSKAIKGVFAVAIIWGIIVLSVIVGIIYVAVHFISKYW